MATAESRQPGLAQAMAGIIRRDLLLAVKRPGDVLNPLFFFAMVSSLYPLAPQHVCAGFTVRPDPVLPEAVPRILRKSEFHARP